ncbi:hypothetical protein PilKf_01425 [Pillotina sp. SPG140]
MSFVTALAVKVSLVSVAISFCVAVIVPSFAEASVKEVVPVHPIDGAGLVNVTERSPLSEPVVGTVPEANAAAIKVILRSVTLAAVV